MKIVVVNLILTLILGLVAIGTAYAIIGINKLKNNLNTKIDKVENENTKLLLKRELDSIETLVLKELDSVSDLINDEVVKLKESNKVPTIEDLEEMVIRIKDKTLEDLQTSTVEVLTKEEICIEDYVEEVVREILEDSFIVEE